MSELNRSIARRVEKAFNAHDLDALTEFYAPDVSIHDAPPGVPQGREGIRVAFGRQFEAFPDLQLTFDEILAERDLVAVLWHTTGTHKGPLMDIPPTGKTVNNSGISIVRLVDGKVVESWAKADNLAVMQQLGVVPAQGS